MFFCFLGKNYVVLKVAGIEKAPLLVVFPNLLRKLSYQEKAVSAA